ncbi:hypothetical protein LXL04_028155 [Taraxacum kok-saghyz]
MAAQVVGYGMFQRVYEGCISTDDMDVRRRPYHHNCSCALHKSGGGHCSHVSKVVYPIRRSRSEASMVAIKPTTSLGSSPSITQKAKGSNTRKLYGNDYYPFSSFQNRAPHRYLQITHNVVQTTASITFLRFALPR